MEGLLNLNSHSPLSRVQGYNLLALTKLSPSALTSSEVRHTASSATRRTLVMSEGTALDADRLYTSRAISWLLCLVPVITSSIVRKPHISPRAGTACSVWTSSALLAITLLFLVLNPSSMSLKDAKIWLHQPDPSPLTSSEAQYAIVIDGGSTGSRMFIYRFSYSNDSIKRDIHSVSSKKITPGLSTLEDRPEAAAAYMRPLFQHAASVIPPEHHSRTLVFIQATAGMRLMPKVSQDAIYSSLYEQLPNHSAFPFKLQRAHIGTLSGRAEGFYAALSVNYLTGRMNAQLQPTRNSKEAVVGALDMGGSSTQIVFQQVEDNMMVLDESDFWVQSYLAYGVDTIRYRLWSQLTRHTSPDGASTVENPCGFLGHQEKFKGHVLKGTGQAEQCAWEVRKMLWEEEHERCSASAPCGLDGIRHPPLTGKFLAMSVFFFALDCMKQLGPTGLPHWPSPSVDEIEQAAQSFCAQRWASVNSSAMHRYTRDSMLPYRCVEVVYIHTLLKHGYGFPGDSRDVTFVLDIDGMEVEWTLGYALSVVPMRGQGTAKGQAGEDRETAAADIRQQISGRRLNATCAAAA